MATVYKKTKTSTPTQASLTSQLQKAQQMLNAKTGKTSVSTDNRITNAMVDAGTLPKTQRENVPQPTASTLTAQLQKAQAMLNQKTGRVTTPTTINSSVLQPVPVVNTTQPPVATGMAGVQGAVQQQTDTYNANLQARETEAKTKSTASTTALEGFMAQLRGETDVTSELYSSKGGVDSVQKELDSINQQILEEQVSLERQVEELEKNPQGMFGGGLEDQIDDTRRESIRKQADLSVIQMGVQGRFDSAKSIADRAVNAYLEKQDLLYKTLQFNYLENKDIFTKAEQRAFESAQADRTRGLEEERSSRKDISDLSLIALENGAPASVVLAMRRGASVEDAILAGASYLRDKSSYGTTSGSSSTYVPQGGYDITRGTNLDTISGPKLKDQVRKMFPGTFGAKIINETTDDQLRDFMIRYTSQVNEQQSNIEPETFYESEYKPAYMAEEATGFEAKLNKLLQ